LPHGLWIVATPIGNLSDFTPRARWALEDAKWLLCEDTRRTAHLFSALGLPLGKNRLSRFDAHVDAKKVQAWVEVLKSGESIALVTDAGTPSVSDPGAALVAAAHEAGVQVTPVPGVSAVSTFLSVAGLVGSSFFFGGFFPRKKSERLQVLKAGSASQLAGIFVWFESPHRIQEAVGLIDEYCSEFYPSATIVVGKELTKIHEKIFRGSSTSVKNQVEQELSSEGILGEWCLAVEYPKSKPDSSGEIFESGSEQEAWKLAFSCLIDEGIPPSRAVKRVSQVFGIPKNRVYDWSLNQDVSTDRKI